MAARDHAFSTLMSLCCAKPATGMTKSDTANIRRRISRTLRSRHEFRNFCSHVRTRLVGTDWSYEFPVRSHQVQNRAVVHRVVVRSRTGAMLGIIHAVFLRHLRDLLL